MDRRAVALMAPLLLVTQLALADPTYEFNIRGASLQSALRQFADQTGLQISYFTKIAEGHTAPEVSGTLTAEAALKLLLKASGLTFERIDPRTLAIYPAPPAQDVTATSNETAAAPPRSKPLRIARAAERSEARTTHEPVAPGHSIIEEVISTGSHIRGVLNETAPVTVLDRRYIERSGFTNLMQLVSSLPMNFKGGTSGATEVAAFGMAPNVGQNLTRGTGFNLRGLGSVATLTLINGRRVAPSAQGQFVDVSTIPMSAVERVEILTDGASAIYGADAVAGVVNIILRKDFQGAETGWEYGATTDRSLDEHRVSQMAGSNWESGNALFIAEYYRRSNLSIEDRDYILEAGAETPSDLLPHRKLGTMVFTLDQQLPANFDFATHFTYSYEEVDVRNTMHGYLEEQTPDTNQWSAGLSLGYEPAGDWRISLDGSIARVETNSDFTYWWLDTGEMTDQLQDYRDKYRTWSSDLKADGTLIALPGGPMRLAVGSSYRKDDLISTRYRTVPNTGFEVRADDTRDVTSLYAELYVPIVGAEQDLTWAKRIDVSLAGRHDDYSDFGSTFNPKFGVVWTPVDSLDLRATYSTSFRAPNVAEKALVRRPVQISSGYLFDPSGAGDLIPIFYLNGSRELTAEESDNVALGFTFRPRSLEGLELSLNSFHIEYTNRIEAVPYDEGALSRRDEFGQFISEIPDDAAAAWLADRLAEGWVFMDWEGIGSTGVRYLYDLRQQNAARTELQGFDATLLYKFNLARDAFDLQLDVTHLGEILTSLAEDTPRFEVVDTYNQPLDWRFRLMGTWIRGGLSTTVAVNHADSYVNDSQAIDVPIGSWTTADLNVSYDFDGRTQSSLLEGTRIAVGVSNVTDREPPRAISPLFPVGFDVFNADAMGRFVSASVTKRW
ncbi:MAG TPA: TonB-dependent receptor [Steroidobacter sp.]|uniref:TonB-dependent receptor n=1 Tax=Steroidobacter sp. TaxID=1978227 RepID=UPI002EDAFF6F